MTTLQRFLKLPEVRESTGQGTTSVYHQIKDGLLTPPIKRGRSSVWPENEITEVQRAIIAGRSDDDLRQLVKDLIAARAHALDAMERGPAAA